jgi:hypothetical protein
MQYFLICNKGGQTQCVPNNQSLTARLANGNFTLGGGLSKTVQTNLEEAWVLYPNPTNSFVQLVLNNSYSGPITITVSDLNGAQLHNETLAKTDQIFTKEISLNHLSNGMYLIMLQTADQVAVHRIQLVK